MDYNVKPMIHRFQQNGMNIVMDVNSGIVHVVDDVTYKVLAYYNGTNRGMVLANLAKDYEEAELNEVMDDLDELIAKEVLFAPMDKNYKMAIEDRQYRSRLQSALPVLLRRAGRLWSVAHADELRRCQKSCRFPHRTQRSA